MKTKSDYVDELKQGDVMMNNEYTFPEYAEQLKKFQDVVCKMVSGDAYHKGMRIEEATFIMESLARKKGNLNETAVRNGLQTMKKLSKEIAITMSGINGEKSVTKALEHMTRPHTQVFRNIFVTDGETRTELDAVVLTDEGIIILEIKKVKSDITLTEDGRMVFADNACYDDIPLCEKMAVKRRLLKKHLEKQLSESGLNIPVYIDSYIVFSAPKGQYIKIDNRYHSQKYCFRSKLNDILENYIGCAYYSEKEIEQLGNIISDMETNVKRFETQLNFDEIRESLAEAMVLIQNEEVQKISIDSVDTTHEIPDGKVINNTLKNKKKKNTCDINRFKYVAASICASVLISGLTIMIGSKANKL